MDSFVSATAYVEEIYDSAWNVVEVLTAEDWRALTFNWRSLGCNKLPLLTKTDRHQMIERWGTPEQHTTLRARHGLIWQKAVDCF